MLPTSYRGNATIDGEIIDAVLRLDGEHLRLTTRADAQILRWPLSSLAVESTGDGEYRLEAGDEHFAFAPLYDDGLGVEIALRRRFTADDGGSVLTAARTQPESDGVSVTSPGTMRRESADDERRRRAAHLATEDAAGIHQPSRRAKKRKAKRLRSAKAAAPLTVADEAIGRASPAARRRGVLEGGDLGLRTALVVLALAAGAIGTVAWLSDDTSPPPDVVLQAPVESSQSTLPFTETETPEPNVVPPATPSTAPVTPTTGEPTTVPSTTVPPTTATSPPDTTAAPAGVFETETVFDVVPAELTARWDVQAAAIEPGLLASELAAEGNDFSFQVGDHVVVKGTTDADGTVGELQFLGDPSGDVDADRRVLASLGLTVAMMEPELPPLGRRQFLAALGLDIDRPDLADLDRSLEYNGRFYRLRWDSGLARLVLSGTETAANPDS